MPLLKGLSIGKDCIRSGVKRNSGYCYEALVFDPAKACSLNIIPAWPFPTLLKDANCGKISGYWEQENLNSSPRGAASESAFRAFWEITWDGEIHSSFRLF